MESPPVVKIQAKFVGNQPLLSLMESNFDNEQVIVQRDEFAVKSMFPLDILIKTTEIYLFEKFVLDPLIKPIAEKINWVNGVKKLLNPIQPFNLVVQINGGNFIEAPLDTNHEITAQIWNIIRKTIDILRAENYLDNISKIRYVPNKQEKLLIICYEQNRPSRWVILEQKKTVEIPNDRVKEIDKPPSADEWAEAIIERAEKYRKFIESKNKDS